MPPRSRAASGSLPAPRRAAPTAAQTKKPQKEPQMYNPIHFKHNLGVVSFLRIYMTIVAGMVVGIFGITGLPGFYAYLASQALCTLPLLMKAGGNTRAYFSAWTQVVLDHVFSSTALLSYVLVWLLAYNISQTPCGDSKLLSSA